MNQLSFIYNLTYFLYFTHSQLHTQPPRLCKTPLAIMHYVILTATSPPPPLTESTAVALTQARMDKEHNLLALSSSPTQHPCCPLCQVRGQA